MAAAYQWGYRIAFIVAGAAPLYLADIASWSTAYLVMAGLMVFGVIGVLFAPAEKVHVIPAIPKIVQARPVAEAVEWALRLVVLLSGALILGSGLSGKGNLLAALLPDTAGAALLAAWTAKPNGFWLQLAAVVIGMAVVVAAAWPLPGTRSQPSLYLSRAFGEPLSDFFRRFGGAAGAIIALICFYRITEFVLNLMNPFYIDVGFTLTEIAEVRKVYGTAMNIIGTFLGGYAIARWGLMRPLIIGAVIAPLSNLSFAWLSTQGPSLLALTATISVQNVAQSFAAICLIAYMSSLTSAGFTATQYALFTSLYALPDKIIATQSGRIVEAAARSAETGGLWAPLKSLFVALPSESYTAGAAKMGLGPSALGAGYFVFFIYTFAIGLIVIPLALWARRQSALNARID
jgi:PAT family beta-lactamase induction signal transducer AmpG